VSAKKLKKHSLITIDGQVCQLTDTPRKAIDGSWLVFYRTYVGSRVERAYISEQELAELAETVRA
jgi:hypothetical protein